MSEINNKISYCDTFCGLGGFTLAMRLAFPSQSHCVWAGDFWKQAAESYTKNFGIKDVHHDITKVDFTSFPEHDLILGGFPCQPFSRAGKWYKSGAVNKDDDLRANLFLNLVEILNIKKPKYFLFENVKGLTQLKNEDGSLYLDVILDLLRGAGYNVHHLVINSAKFGVPQKRERVLFLGKRSDVGNFDNFKIDYSKYTPMLVRDILEPTVSSKYLIRNILKDSVITNRSETTLKANHTSLEGTLRSEVLETMTANSKVQVKPGTPTILAQILGDTPSGASRQLERVYSIDSIAPTVICTTNPFFNVDGVIRKLTPRECARLQSIPDSYQLPEKDGVAYKLVGNAVSPVAIAEILKLLVTN